MKSFPLYERELKKHKYLELLCSSLLTITCILLLFLPCFKIDSEMYGLDELGLEISVSLFNDLSLAIKLFDKSLFGLYATADAILFYYSTVRNVVIKYIFVIVSFTLLIIGMCKLIKRITKNNAYETSYYQCLKGDTKPKKNLLAIATAILFCLFIQYVYFPISGTQDNDGYFHFFTGELSGKCVDYYSWINGLDYGVWVVTILSLITLSIAIFSKIHGAIIKKKISTNLYLDKINKQKEKKEDEM